MIRSNMSHPVNDALMDKAVDLAIEFWINKGIDHNNNPVFDKIVDKKAAQIFEELMNRPGPHG